jgi:hypothetical protein
MNAIIPGEIKEKECVRAMVKQDDVEEEMLGVVTLNTGRGLVGVRFLTPTEKFYKNAPVWVLEDEVTAVPWEALTEHHPDCALGGLDFKSVGEDLWVALEDIDVEETDSEVWSDTDTDLSGFIVSDGDVSGQEDTPEGAREIDRAWDEWNPGSVGARSFKDTVDAIEARIRHSF